MGFPSSSPYSTYENKNKNVNITKAKSLAALGFSKVGGNLKNKVSVTPKLKGWLKREIY